MKVCNVCSKENVAFQLVCKDCLNKVTNENIKLKALVNDLVKFAEETRSYFVRDLGGKSCWTEEIDPLLEKVKKIDCETF